MGYNESNTIIVKSLMEHGNFSNLAEKYSQYRPGYSQSVLNSLFALLDKNIETLDLADVGAGTGIWTRMLASTNPKTITAIEPNDDMRNQGTKDSTHTKIKWQKGNGESTGLKNQSVDMVSMASSFHWVDFDKGTQEFHRILKDGGRFVALWNPRLIEASPLIQKLEDYIYELKPDLVRKSSGSSGITQTLTEQLTNSPLFTDVVYLEGRNTITITPEHYIGAWWSVNDVQFQLGKEKFAQFIAYLESELKGTKTLEVTYLTRAWSAKKKD